MKELFLTFLAFGHIHDLGSNEYNTREAAQEKLTLLGHAALPALQWGTSDKDCEIRCRCDRGVALYYQQVALPQVSIWYLPDEKRFVNGKDIAKDYYEQARLLTRNKRMTPAVTSWKVNDFAWQATKLYIFDRLKTSECREEIDSIRFDMDFYYHELIGESGITDKELDVNGVPKSIADRRQIILDNPKWGYGGDN